MTKLTFLIKFVFIIFVATYMQAYSQQADDYQNNLSFEWGNNIWGNTFSLGYDLKFSKHFFGGLSLGTGYFHADLPDNGQFLFVRFTEGTNNTLSLDFKQIINLNFGYVRTKHEGFCFVNKFEIGLSYSHFTFKDVYTDFNPYYGYSLWKGSKDFGLYALTLSGNIFTYSPKFNDHLSFDFGVRLRTTMTGPESLLYESPGLPPRLSQLNYNNSASVGYIWFYPDMYLKINYGL